jgi:hypothetical protein
LGEVFGVRVGDQAQGRVAEGEFGVAEQGGVGGGDQSAGHVQDVGGRPGGDAGGQLLGAGFEFGGQRFSHRKAPATRGNFRATLELTPK